MMYFSCWPETMFWRQRKMNFENIFILPNVIGDRSRRRFGGIFIKFPKVTSARSSLLSNHWTVGHSTVWPLDSWTQHCPTDYVYSPPTDLQHLTDYAYSPNPNCPTEGNLSDIIYTHYTQFLHPWGEQRSYIIFLLKIRKTHPFKCHNESRLYFQSVSRA